MQALIYALLFVVFNGRHAFAALRFCYFWIKEKGLAPAAVSRGKTEPKTKPTLSF